jgi:signal transduction histidine kinase
METAMRAAPRVGRTEKVRDFPPRVRGATAARIEPAVRRLNDTLEQQAKRIAQSLHDEAGQLLTSAHIALTDVARELPPAARARLQEIRGTLDRIEEQLRRVAYELHPRVLDDLGLVGALHFLAEGVGYRRGIAVTVEGRLHSRLPGTVEATLYRLVQEALTNVGKHARASQVRIRIKHGHRLLRCIIEDNGIGFDVPALPARVAGQGLGLSASRERLAALGGTLRITSGHGRGTELVITIPLGK